jgi:outer membrane receptor protein involved in Fe transport
MRGVILQRFQDNNFSFKQIRMIRTIARTVAAAALIMMSAGATANVVRGKIVDAKSDEEIMGATVRVDKVASGGAVTGLNGAFSIDISRYPCTLVCSYLGYKPTRCVVSAGSHDLLIKIQPSSSTELSGITVLATNRGKSETGARTIEMQSMNVVNVMSAKAIDLSPDLTVANVIKRMSGVTVEKDQNGDGQYALLRGMDKRYNYTLVNGVKIPSPDAKNRYVPLDIFPSEMLDRLEVVKSLTANLEGDGIGGAVNMVMKDAPTSRQLTFNLSTGYNAYFFDHDNMAFRASGISSKSPNEQYGVNYPVKMKDFTTRNLRLTTGHPLPNIGVGLSYGDRFAGNRLGVMLAGNFQNNYRGSKSSLYGSVGSDGVQTVTDRQYADEQTRLGAHAKVDFVPAENHKITWYNGYMSFTDRQVRDAQTTSSEVYRLRWNNQYILTSILKGEHLLCNRKLSVRWTAEMAKANNRTPDNTLINLTTATDGTQWVAENQGATRRWEHNNDRDKAGYADLEYKMRLPKGSMELAAGGMYRDKKRSSFFNEYSFKPYDERKAEATRRELVRGTDWNNFDEIQFEVKEYGDLSNPLNYGAAEKVGAGYGQLKYEVGRWHLTAGVRMEHTDHSYHLKFVTANARNDGSQRYWDCLPDVHVKYALNKTTNVRLSYNKAINRPSFFEIVPYTIINEDYTEHGNPDLKHTTADNFDLRMESFPHPSEQLMACAFFKKLKNPIEYGMISGFGQDTYYMPGNYGTAYNYGLELDFMKYFNRFGVKANYTYTHSHITTQKIQEVKSEGDGSAATSVTEYVDQSRPLAGQAAHVVNVSLLYKDSKNGLDGQLSLAYTGKKLYIVSRFYNNDSWLAGNVQLDASMEKSFRNGICVFFKGSDLLSSPIIQYIHKNSRTETVTNAKRHDGGVVERTFHYGQNIMIGVKYKL